MDELTRVPYGCLFVIFGVVEVARALPKDTSPWYRTLPAHVCRATLCLETRPGVEWREPAL